jgi:hypothetical protein
VTKKKKVFLRLSPADRFLSEGVPQDEGQTQPYDGSDDDGVSPLAKVDLLDEVVDHRKP